MSLTSKTSLFLTFAFNHIPMKKLSQLGYSVVFVLSAFLLQSCGDSYDVIPSPGMMTYKFKLYDSTVYDYYLPAGDTVARDTVTSYIVNTTISFLFDSVHDFVILDDDTLRSKGKDTIGYWSKGKGAFEYSTHITFNRDSLRINRFGQSITPVMKQLKLSGNPEDK